MSVVKKLDVEVLGWCGHTWSTVVRSVGRTAKFSKITWDAAYSREINSQFSVISSGGHSCSQHANCTVLQNLTSVALCCVTKLHILVAIHCPQHKMHLCNGHAVLSAS
jgi:hypothetical protein